MIGTIEAPCKDCPNRVLHCHSTCGAYQEYNTHREQVRELRKKRVDEADFMRQVKHKAAKINLKCKKAEKARRR